MSETDARDRTPDSVGPDSASSDIEEALGKARALLETGDVEDCLVLLENLQPKYVRGIELFDLLGDVLLRRGNIEDGIRYKTLHEILKGTFRIVGEEKKAHAPGIPAVIHLGPSPTEEGESEATATEPGQVLATGVAGEEEGEAEGPVSAVLFPMTAEMGHELMRQGHFSSALEIYETLLRTRPEDDTLKEAREKAHKKTVAQKLLGVLQGWLLNIEKMKAQLPTRP